jgi:hypothetical protein
MSPSTNNILTIRLIQIFVIFLIAILILYQFNAGIKLTGLDIVIITALALILTFFSYQSSFSKNRTVDVNLINITEN